MFLRSLALGACLTAAVFCQDPVRVSEEDGRKLIVSKTEPDYPAMAKQMRLSGRVVVDVFLDQDGKVEKAQPVNGNPLLSGAAVNAVKKWKFSPYSAGGQNQRAVTSVAFMFKL